MYTAGRYADTVTRYNHKDTTRWMCPPERREITLSGMLDGLLMAACVAGCIVSAVLILQGVSL